MKYLFHYTSIEILKLILENNELKINKINKTNDPHESQKINVQEILFAREHYLRKKKNYYEKKLKNICDEFTNNKESLFFEPKRIELIRKNKELKEESVYLKNIIKMLNKKLIKFSKYIQIEYFHYDTDFNERRNNIVKVACFSNGNLDEITGYEKIIPSAEKRPGFYYPRMWAQYGKKSEGACIIFDKKKLDECFYKNGNKYRIIQGNVNYIDILEQSHIKKIKKSVFSLDSLNYMSISTFLIKNATPLFFTKDVDWEGEHEYRYLVLCNIKIGRNGKNIMNLQRKEIYLKLEDSISYIILGENANENTSDYKNFCLSKNIPIYKITRNNFSYQLIKLL
jgi:hypothetical protein